MYSHLIYLLLLIFPFLKLARINRKLFSGLRYLIVSCVKPAILHTAIEGREPINLTIPPPKFAPDSLAQQVDLCLQTQQVYCRRNYYTPSVKRHLVLLVS